MPAPAGDLTLEVYEGVGQVRRLPLPDGAALVVGRVKTCDVVLLANGVSRQHCRLTRAGDVLEVENLSSSKAGTQVAGKRVEGKARVRLDDEVCVGEAVLIVRAGAVAPPASVETATGAAAHAAPGGAATADAAPGSAEHEREQEDEEPDAAREAARAFVQKKRLERTLKLVAGLVLLAGLSGTAAWSGLRWALDPRGATPPGDGGPPHVTEGVTPGDQGASPERAWVALQSLPADQLELGLQMFAERFPRDPRAADALFFAGRLAGLKRASTQPSGGGRLRPEVVGDALRAEVDRARDAGQLARAARLLALATTLAPGSPLARAAAAEQARLVEAAAAAVDDLGKRARELTQRLGPVQGLKLVLDERARLRGLGHDEALDALVADLEEQAARALMARHGPALDVSPRATTVEKEGVDAALRFDLETAWARLDELLTLRLSDEARLRAHWLRHQVRGLEALLAALNEAAEGAPERRPTLTIRGQLKARLRSATTKEVLLAPVVEQGEGELKRPWTRITPFQVQELAASVGQGDATLTFARAFHAFSTGLEDQGMELLVLLAQSRRRLQGEVFSFYALVSGTPMPEGGFVIDQGRLVDPAERERRLAAREAARRAAQELAAEAREAGEQRKLALLLQKVLALLDAGNYEAGRAALQRIAERHADVPGVGDVARARLQSPVLRRRDMRASRGLGSNGPSKNRLDIDFMGDGFVLDDQRQAQFDRYADSAMKFCQLQDFFKEYDAYINYWACNTASKDEGLTKDTGDPKDTALRGRIEGGVYTIGDRASAFALLEDQYPDAHDRLVVGIGNDFANVATGGGGVVACAKTMLSAVPHELGHAFGGLGDEYDHDPTGGGAAPPSSAGRVPARVLGPNLIAGDRRDEMLELVPWKDWLDPVGDKNWTGKPIDLFEGGDRQPKNVWRAQRACVMRDVGSPFCAPCMEQMVLKLYRFVRPIDQVWPDEQELTLDEEPLLLRVLVMKPRTHDLFVHWRRKTLSAAPRAATGEDEAGGPGTRTRPDGGVDVEATPEVKDLSGRLTTDGVHFIHYIKLSPRDLEPGRYELSAEVWDPTPWVLEKHRGPLRQTRTWIVTVPPRGR